MKEREGESGWLSLWVAWERVKVQHWGDLQQREGESNWSYLGVAIREIKFENEEISGKGNRDVNDEKENQGKVLSVVDGGFKKHPIVIPSNNFIKSWEKLKKVQLDPADMIQVFSRILYMV